MDADEKLRKRVNWLNGKGGFNDSLRLDQVMQAAFGLEIGTVMKVLKDLEEKKGTVNDPTAYVVSGLRRAGGGQGGAPPPAWGPPPAAEWAAAPEGDPQDKALRKRIGWLNSAGGFNGAINYQKIIAQAFGLEYSAVFDVLKQVEAKKGEVNDPTGWVCTALRKMGGGGGPAAGGPPPPAYGFAPPAPMPMAFPPAGGGGADADTKLRKRIDWLNSQGGFAGAIDLEKIYAAARGLEITVVMKILKDLEEKRDTVKDPNAYAGAALRKLGGGAGGGPPAAFAAPPAYPPAFGAPMPDAFAAAAWGGGGDAAAEDQKLRKRIGWLNKAGGFDGAIHYQKILDAAKGLEYSEVMRLLKDVEEKREGIKDPTGWICAALKKKGGGGAAMMPPVAFPPAFPMPGMAYPAAGGGEDADTKLRKRIGWLNKQGGFNDTLNYQKVSEAAMGMEIREVMELLKEVEEKKDQVKDPTGWTVVALRKRKERAMSGLPPAKRART